MTIISAAITARSPNFETISTYTLANLSSYLDGYTTASDGYPNLFDILERISAGYIMNTMDFGKLHVVAGVRFEATQMNTMGYNVTLYGAGDPNCVDPTGCGVPVPEQTNPSYVDPLPSVSLRYALDSNPACAWSMAAASRVPTPTNWCPTSPRTTPPIPPTIAEGNPTPQPEHANNLRPALRTLPEVRGDHSGRVFLQADLDDTLISTSYTATSGQYDGRSRLAVAQRQPCATLRFRGLVPAAADLSSRPACRLRNHGQLRLDGFKGQHIPGRPDSPALQHQVPSVWNISPDYTAAALPPASACLITPRTFTITSISPTRIRVDLGPRGPNGDIYTLAHLQVDAQASVRLGHGITAMVYGLNLTNEVFGYYQGSPIFVNQQEWYKPTFALGLRYSFNHEK